MSSTEQTRVAAVRTGSLNGLRALVTGATTGIGRATARRLAANGAAEVIVHGRDTERGARVIEEIERDGGSARFLAADASDPTPNEREKTDVVGPSSIEPPGAHDRLPASAAAEDASTDAFGRRLLVGVTGGALVALAVVSIATFWLRRTL